MLLIEVPAREVQVPYYDIGCNTKYQQQAIPEMETIGQFWVELVLKSLVVFWIECQHPNNITNNVPITED